MSVIIRLQNLPWSANALDIRNFFRGLSIPEGGVHIVGGELGDAFIAFSTDEDARQGFMLDGGKIKEVQVKLLLSSRSEMHKVIEAARQSVPLPVVAPALPPAPAPPPIQTSLPAFLPALTPSALNSIPGLGNPLEVPQPAVIPPPAPLLSPPIITTPDDNDTDTRRTRDKRRTKSSSRSRSRSRERSERKRGRRDRSRSRDRGERRRRNERSRSRDRRDRRDRRRDREMKTSRERSPSRRRVRESPQREPDPKVQETYSRLQEIGNKRNPLAFQGNGVSADPPPAPPAPRIPPAPLQPGACVVIRDAPTHTSYGDVRRFFPAMIDKHGIKMINDNMGHRTGNIYVRFVDPRSKQMVLQRKHTELKGSLVTVEHLDEAEYDMAVDSFLPFREENAPTMMAAPPCCILRLSDLPFYIQEHDIIKALNEYSLLSIVLNMNRSNRTKTAFVQFAKVQDAQLALRNKDRLVFGKRQALVTALTDEEYEQEKAIQTSQELPIQSSQEPPIEEPLENVEEPPVPRRDPRQRRPDPATVNNFTPNPAPFTPFNSNGPFNSNPPFQQERPWGRGFAPQQPEFRNFQNFQPEPEYLPTPKRPFAQNGTSPVDEPLECVLMKGLPRDATDRTIVEFLRETGAVPSRIHLMLDGGGRPSGDCFCEFRSPGDARRAAARHGATLHDLRVSVDLVPRSLVRAALDAPAPPSPAPAKMQDIQDNRFVPQPPESRFAPQPPESRFAPQPPESRFGPQPPDSRFGPQPPDSRFAPQPPDSRFGSQPPDSRFGPPMFRGRGGFRGRGAPRGGRGRGRGAPPRDDDPALMEFGAPGCVVSMENVPFRATVEDILQFFSEFELSQDDVIRRFNDRGQATGDARVAFPTPFDAQRAVKTHHMEMIHDRRITLTIV